MSNALSALYEEPGQAKNDPTLCCGGNHAIVKRARRGKKEPPPENLT